MTDMLALLSAGDGLALRRRRGQSLSVIDSFNRTDSATPGVTDSGHTWIEIIGDWAIEGNRLRLVTTGGENLIGIDNGKADGPQGSTLAADATPGVGQYQHIVRYSDADNMYSIGLNNWAAVAIFKKEAGAWTQIATAAHAWAVGDVLRIDSQGSQLDVYVNDMVTPKVSVTDAHNINATTHGLNAVDSATRFDDYYAP